MFTVIGHSQCTYCKQAIQLLATKGHSFIYKDARQEDNKFLVEEMKANGLNTVPQIWKDEEHIGGFADLQLYLTTA